MDCSTLQLAICASMASREVTRAWWAGRRRRGQVLLGNPRPLVAPSSGRPGRGLASELESLAAVFVRVGEGTIFYGS